MRWMLHSALFVLLLAGPAHADVAKVQTSLKSIGCYGGEITGRANLALRTASRCFQNHIGADPDGTLSTEEEAALHRMAASGATVSAQPSYTAKQPRGDEMPRYDPNASGEQRFAAARGNEQSAELATDAELVARLNELINTSLHGGGLTVGASRTFPERAADLALIMVSVGGVPTVTYAPLFTRDLGWQLGMTASCASRQGIDLTFLLRDLSGVEPLPQGERLTLTLRAFGGGETEVPVTIIDTPGTSGRLVRVRATMRADDRFLDRMQPTSNLQAQLKEDGRFTQFTSGTSLTTFFEDLRPLLDVCSERVRPERFTPEGDTDEQRFVSSVFEPTEGEMLAALRSRVSEMLLRIDNQESECARARIEGDSQLSAVCLFGIRPEHTSRNVQWSVASLDLNRCWAIKVGEVICNYAVEARVNTANLTALPFVYAGWAEQIATAEFGRFERIDGRWIMTWAYASCTITETTSRCNGAEL